MILADKIVALRKKNGWSQEELAEKMNVSRQSVSKWEGAQSVPELEKILQLSQLFGVSTDYLLKDELEEAEYVSCCEEAAPIRRVSMEEASEFLCLKQLTAKRIALATCDFPLHSLAHLPNASSRRTANGDACCIRRVCGRLWAHHYVPDGSGGGRTLYFQRRKNQFL